MNDAEPVYICIGFAGAGFGVEVGAPVLNEKGAASTENADEFVFGTLGSAGFGGLN